MRRNEFKSSLRAVLGITTFFLAVGLSFGQQQVNVTAGPATATLPDGTPVPMWGYSCGTAVAGSTATCAALNPAATSATIWSPIIITVPSGQALTINLTNHLSFGSTPNNIPTSIVIVGQWGGGLGTPGGYTPAPDHSNAQPVTWPIAGTPPGAAPVGAGTPPAQGPRVQSFSTEVPATVSTSTDSTALTWPSLRPGTYLIESGTHPSIQGPMGLYGMLVVAAPRTTNAALSAYPGVNYNADVPLLLSEIDAIQNAAVNSAVHTVGFSESLVWSGQPGGCGNPSSASYQTCYPPAVNYDPRYYLVNGAAADRTHLSALSASAPASIGQILVRFVNAGLRMHVPSIVGARTNGATGVVSGFALIAEDGNVVPDVALAIANTKPLGARVQSEVFLPAGKTFDVMMNAPAAGGAALPVFDRALSLSTSNQRDGGMQAYISVNGGALPAITTTVTASGETYYCVAGVNLTVSDPANGVLANDKGANGALLGTVSLVGGPASLTFNADGTFTYTQQSTSTTCGGTFTYLVNGTSSATATVTQCDVSSHAACGTAYSGSPTANADSYASNVASRIQIGAPGVLANDKDPQGHPLTASAAANVTGGTVTLNPDGSFAATPATPPTGTATATVTFQYHAVNSQLTPSASAATVTVTFNGGSNLNVTVLDGVTKAPINDYRWIIEEDRTFYVNPACTTNPPPAGCPTAGGIVPTFGTNFHTSYMPVVATGCIGPAGTALACEGGQTIVDPATGNHVNAVCDVGNGICRPDPTGDGFTAVDPRQVHLDPTKRYYFSVLPGDAANPFANAYLGSPDCSPSGVAAGHCGHGMGGAPIAAGQTAVTVLTQASPYPPAKLSVFVFEDDFPLNGEQDAGGGIDVLARNEPGLGSFEITLFDDAGGTGDSTGQPTYDMFNQPLTNSLAGTIDPATGKDACPISVNPRQGVSDPTQTGISGMIVTCPRFESDGLTLSPLAGQAVISNLYPGRYGVVATPGADRIARGEEWLQTNTLDGQKAHDSFLRIGEPNYFQEFGPAGYHVSIGFANPKIINGRRKGVCNGTDPDLTATNCTNTVTGIVTTERMSRPPDERLYSSGDNSSFAFTQCYVSFGDPDGEDFAFTKCNADGTFSMSGLPDGTWRITVFDQWNDMLVDGLSTPVRLGSTDAQCPGPGSAAGTCDIGAIAMNQWQANIYTTTFFDANGNGIRDSNEAGLTLVPTNIRFRDGSFSNFNNTDLNGNAGFNEVFPLFSWYVIETDSTRYKNTGTHVVYDAGGPADGTPCANSTPPGPTGSAPCGNSAIGQFMANTAEQISLPANLRVPGAVYCANADCTGKSIANGPGSSDPPSVCTTNSSGVTTCSSLLSTGRIDPPWVVSEGWQGFSGQNSFINFGKKRFAVGENGGIRGHVVYASTRPFDDPQLLLQTSWEPLVPGVTINLYHEGTALDGSQSLTLVDTTRTSSWDDWAQGFRSDGIPNMNCPGQGQSTGTAADLFFFTLYNQPMWLDAYNNGGTAAHTIPDNSQFKCYDGMHNWNQIQPAPYDGMYQFPSIVGRNPTTGAPTGAGSTNGTPGLLPGTNCTICVANPTDGTPMLPAGKYVVEVIVPPGYELVKEEDKNILIGDNYIAPVTVEFPGLGGGIYILPDQAAVGAEYNANNAQNPTQNLGATPRHEGDTGSVETFWPCVGKARIVPDYISLFPQSHEVSPFAGATRNLCDRKEVTLDDQTSALAKFYIFTSTHVAG